MAHGKETPRQKMIGMMYLVLMAMLALNVSNQVLDAFVLVDEGLVKTTKNFAHKNDVYYQEFDRAAAENPVKAGPWQAKALEVKQRSDELVGYIQELKIELVKRADGDEAAAVHGDELHAGEIKAKDELNKPAEQMIGPDGGGKGNDLKMAIEELRDYFFSLIPEENADVHESIEASLDTHDHEGPDGEMHSWINMHFAHNPLVGVVALMSKMQSDVRNAESETLAYLYGQIDAGSFKFNLIEPIVIPKSTNVIRGNDFEASVFMAAFDTTQAPIVYIGQYDSTVNQEDGTVEYNMVGTLGTDYDTIPVTGGRGVYRVRGSSLGEKKWAGIISLKRMDGSYTNKPFQSSYVVNEPALVVSPTEMNVFYNAIENPVEISVPGYPANSIRATINNGRMVGSGTRYTVTPNRLGTATVSVSVTVDGQTKSMGTKEFRVDAVPPPYPTLAGVRGGPLRRSAALAELGLKAQMPDWFKFGGVSYTITSYEFEAQVQGMTKRVQVRGDKFDSEIRQVLRESVRAGSSVYFNDIKAVGPDGSVVTLSTLGIRIQ